MQNVRRGHETSKRGEISLERERSILDDLRPTYRGLDAVRMNKETLIQIVTDNRTEHRSIFEEAIDNWQKEVVKRLETLVTEAKNQPPAQVQIVVNLPKPEDHTSDYDRVLKMLELSLDNELELTDREFAQFVMDDWGWQKPFLTTSSMYSGQARDKFSRISGG